MTYRILLVLVTVFSGGCQGIECQIFPANYTFITRQLVTSTDLDIRNCTQRDGNTTCYHPSTLTDSVIGGDNVFTTKFIGGARILNFHNRDYYLWEPHHLFQVLFTFPSATTLTGITLYYYSDRNGNDEPEYGLPSLNFTAEEDNFKIGSPLRDSTVALFNTGTPEEGEMNGTTKTKHFNVTQSVPTRKVLMSKTIGNFRFALSEIEFFAETDHSACNSTSPPVTTYENSSQETPLSPTVTSPTISISNNRHNSSQTLNTSVMPTVNNNRGGTSSLLTYVAAAVAAIVIIGVTLTIVVVFVFIKYRKSVKEKTFREQASQPPQLQLSPLTGQVESPHREKADETPYNTQNDNNDTELVDATYAVVDKKRKKKKKEPENTDLTARVPDKSVDEPVLVDATYAVVDKKKKKINSSDDDQQPSLESQDDPSHATYDVVDKKKKEEEPLSDDDPPPIPEHTVDQLYAAVQKKKKKTPPEDNDDTPPIPPHTMEELYTAVQKNTDKDTDPPPIPAYKGEDQ